MMDEVRPYEELIKEKALYRERDRKNFAKDLNPPSFFPSQGKIIGVVKRRKRPKTIIA